MFSMKVIPHGGKVVGIWAIETPTKAARTTEYFILMGWEG